MNSVHYLQPCTYYVQHELFRSLFNKSAIADLFFIKDILKKKCYM